MDGAIGGSVPGMETILRRRDLPSFFRAKQLTEPGLQIGAVETRRSAAASALILNTFEDLEAPVLAQIRAHFPTVYTIGPVHAHLKSRLLAADAYSSSSSSSLWKEDRRCMEWLDTQPPKSVLYVSFGSLTVVTPSQLLDFGHGLVNSQIRFLWVIRSDLVNGSGEGEGGEIPELLQLLEATRERGFLVDWAPQEEILAHPAVGGFFTHSGWNSTLESIVAGVPMMCWPYFADQQVNSRYVGHVWGIGLDMKDRCEREAVARMVRELMHGNGEMRKSAAKMADLARKSVARGGSSYVNLERLIGAIRAINL